MFHSVDVKELNDSLFAQLDKKWMLVTAGNEDCCNTMTAGWGGLGVLWGAPAATCYIRPQRYTKEFLDREEYFTLSFFEENYRPQLALCGKESGRDTDKVKKCGFTVCASQCGAPYFEEAELVLVCRKRYVQPMDPDAIPADIKERWYPEKDYHITYIGEVVEILKK